MTRSEEIEEIKHSLDIIRRKLSSHKDDLLKLLLDMIMLHLSRKLTSVTNRPTLPKLHNLNIRLLERNNLRLSIRQVATAPLYGATSLVRPQLSNQPPHAARAAFDQ